MSEIIAKIAAIINQDNIVINKGKKDGIEINMIFGIKLPIPKIEDPDNAENIIQGLFFTKGKIQVKQVNDNMSFTTLLPTRTSYMIDNISIGIDKPINEYPKISNDILINNDDWMIQKGDEVYLIEKEKQSKT